MDFIKRLWKYVKVYRNLFIILFCWVIIINGVNLIYPIFTKILIDDVLVQGNLKTLNIVLLSLVGVFILKSMAVSLEIVTSNKLQQGVIFRLRNHLYYKLQKLSLSYFEKEQKGPIVSKVMTDVDACQTIITDGFIIMSTALLSLTGSLIILIKLNFKLTLITMIPMPFIGILIYNFSEQAHAGYRQVRKKIAEVTSVLQENIFGIREIKTFTREDKEMRKFSTKGKGFFRINMQVAKLWSFYYPLIIFCSAMGTVLVLWFGGRDVIQGEMSIGTLVAFLGYLGLFYTPIHQLNQVNNTFQHARAAAERIFEIIDMTPDIKDKPNAISLPVPLKGEVIFKNVSFSYEKKEKGILHNISFGAKPGEIIAIVGPSGSGKTTIISLIPRFYDITSGKILIDGRNMQDYKLFYMRSQIGMVLQEPFLFSGTVAENITFGKMSTSREEITEVAKAAHAHDFINELSDGYDTEIGEQGTKLSGGQKQRIAIARALLKNPPILILDEATSSVDSETEKLIQAALDKLMEGRTSFVIAHRLSTIRNASKIIVLKDGRIVEMGTHKELLKKRGLYFYLYKIQFGFEEIKDEIPFLMKEDKF